MEDGANEDIVKVVVDVTKLKLSEFPKAIREEVERSRKLHGKLFSLTIDWLIPARQGPRLRANLIPREESGDVDNVIKKVTDCLGPIIGFRRK